MPKPNRIEVTLPPETQARIQRVMDQTNLQRSSVIRMLLEDGLNRWESKNRNADVGTKKFRNLPGTFAGSPASENS